MLILLRTASAAAATAACAFVCALAVRLELQIYADILHTPFGHSPAMQMTQAAIKPISEHEQRNQRDDMATSWV